MIVTFEDNGVSKLSEYPDNKSFDEISQLLHNSSVQMQYLEYFNSLVNPDSSNVTLGWALELVSKKKFYSRVEKIVLYRRKTLRDFTNVVYKK